MPPIPPPPPDPQEYLLVRHPSYYVNAIQPGSPVRLTVNDHSAIDGLVLDLTTVGVTLLCTGSLSFTPWPEIRRLQWLTQ